MHFKLGLSMSNLLPFYPANYQQAGSEVKNEVKINDPEFRVHLWNGKPSVGAELKTWGGSRRELASEISPRPWPFTSSE
jgi:hypothetical protein